MENAYIRHRLKRCKTRFPSTLSIQNLISPKSGKVMTDLVFFQKCQLLKNKLPNFITVDFYETGDALDVVKQFNSQSLLVEL